MSSENVLCVNTLLLYKSEASTYIMATLSCRAWASLVNSDFVFQEVKQLLADNTAIWVDQIIRRLRKDGSHEEVGGRDTKKIHEKMKWEAAGKEAEDIGK